MSRLNSKNPTLLVCNDVYLLCLEKKTKNETTDILSLILQIAYRPILTSFNCRFHKNISVTYAYYYLFSSLNISFSLKLCCYATLQNLKIQNYYKTLTFT